MRKLLVITLLVGACAIYLFGCSGILLHHALDKGDNLTPAQIREYRESGQSVYGCFSLSGPPGSGSMVWIIAPANAVVSLQWLDGCHIMPFATRP